MGLLLRMTVFAPIAEEIFFRYFLYRFFKSKMTALGAMLLTASIFALLHFNVAAFFPLLVMGMFLSSLYEHYGNLV
ncbi:MAG: CPBP family intramembrane metalloprotease, partial [Puniceicoccales bacterium]|nr:CPBP family intramembrane metalloprotease [Puniceicoccales bacterium]